MGAGTRRIKNNQNFNAFLSYLSAELAGRVCDAMMMMPLPQVDKAAGKSNAFRRWE